MIRPVILALLAIVAASALTAATVAGQAGPAITPQERTESLNAVKTKFDSLPGQDPDADNQEMLNFLNGRPEFVAAGISDISSVWATYTDGIEIIIVNNRKPPEQSPPPSRSTADAAAEAAAAATELPTPDKGRAGVFR